MQILIITIVLCSLVWIQICRIYGNKQWYKGYNSANTAYKIHLTTKNRAIEALKDKIMHNSEVIQALNEQISTLNTQLVGTERLLEESRGEKDKHKSMLHEISASIARSQAGIEL